MTTPGSPRGSSTGTEAELVRRAELSDALDAVRARIDRACAAAGRPVDEVDLLAVTKGHPAADVAALAKLGQSAFAESKAQEAGSKIAEVAELRPEAALRWHLVGRLQTNKARAVAAWASRVESVDSERLVDALDAAVRRAGDTGADSYPDHAARPGGRLPVLLQVSIDGDPTRGGATAEQLPALADRIAGCAGLELHGVMAIAPAAAEPDRAFATVHELAQRLRAEHPVAQVISAGMSGDLEAAIRHGSTCVRVGTALMGQRPITSG
ncbi:MAG: YggS family pyridoxal phosphate-dependent enzyme [Pseudonocardia sp.]